MDFDLDDLRLEDNADEDDIVFGEGSDEDYDEKKAEEEVGEAEEEEEEDEDDVEEDDEESITSLAWNNETFNDWLVSIIGKQPVFHIDLVSEMGATVLVLIDLDGLLCWTLEKQVLDFEHGGQFLQAIYMVEKYLFSLSQRQVKFRLFYSEEANNIYPSPSQKLLRKIVLKHLQSNCKCDIDQVPAWWEEKYKQYLQEKNPSCIILHDGSLEQINSSKFSEDTESYFKGAIISSLRSFPVAVFQESSFDESGIMSFVFTCENKSIEESLASLMLKGKEPSKVFKSFKINWLKQIKLTPRLSSSDYLHEVLANIQELTEENESLNLDRIGLSIAACKSIEQLCTSDLEIHILYLIIFQTFLLECLPVSARSFSLGQNSNEKVIQEVINKYLKASSELLEELDGKFTLYDYFDGRLVFKLSEIFLEKTNQANFTLPKPLDSLLANSWQVISKKKAPLGAVTRVNKKKKGQEEEEEEEEAIEMFPIADEGIKEIVPEWFEPTIGEEEAQEAQNLDFPYSVYNWKSTRTVEHSSIYSRDKDTNLKQEQKFARYFEKLSKDHKTQPKHIVKEESGLLSKSVDKKAQKGETKKATSAAAQKIIEENLRKKEKEMEEKTIKTFEYFFKRATELDKSDFNGILEILKEKNYLEVDKSLPDSVMEKIAVSVLNLLMECRKFHPEKKNLKHMDIIHLDKTIVKLCRSIMISRIKTQLVPVELLKKVRDALNECQFKAEAERLALVIKSISKDQKADKASKGKPGAGKNVKEKAGKETKASGKNAKAGGKPKGKDQKAEEIPKPQEEEEEEEEEEEDENKKTFEDFEGARSLIEFQMEYLGSELLQGIELKEDPRAEGFIPDPWQVRLLDLVDANKSSLVCAPTSAGKTFISFYCMEKILRRSDEDVVVYVAPTKALVNQVIIDIIGKFDKNYNQPGRHLWGSFTNDYRHNSFNSQILVTIPESFKILLTSPKLMEWASRIKYVIFDEIHCISDSKGAVWEQLLMLIRCPFLALSASVGNPDDFSTWLQEILAVKSNQDGLVHEFELIDHRERYSHLENFSYDSKKEKNLDLQTKIYDMESITKQLSSAQPFYYRHPLTMVDFQDIKKNKIPEDFRMSPRASIDVYRTLIKESKNFQLSAQEKDSIRMLHPEYFYNSSELSGKLWLDRPGCKRFEQSIISFVKESSNTNEKLLKNVIEKLKGGNELHQPKKSHSEQHLVPMILSLYSQSRLPALCFDFSRTKCEKYLKKLTEYMELVETKHPHRINEIEKENENRQIQIDKLNAEKERRNNLDKKDMQAASAVTTTLIRVLPTFTFTPMKYQLSTEELEDILKELERANLRRDNILVRALQRGIGVHHPGLPTRYRQTVERLFRKRYLQVVFATETLALGINMPCHSVVFMDDSVFLTPLMFRQMSGRAGRRGFDPNGEVFFLSVPEEKIQKLIVSDMPKLTGKATLSPSFLLQMMSLYKVNPKAVKDQIECFFEAEPLFTLGRKTANEYMKTYALYVIQFLMHLVLLSPDCTPKDFNSMLYLLSSKEPANFVLLTLLRSGYLHRVVENEDSKQVVEKLLLIFVQLFDRTRLHPYAAQAAQKKNFNIFLPPPDEEVSAYIEQYNEEVFNTFYSFAKRASQEIPEEERLKLPLSSFSTQKQNDLSDNVSDVILLLKDLSNENSVCSPLMGLSGQTDNFKESESSFSSAIKLMIECGSVELELSTKIIPVFDISSNHQYNSYIMNYFKHRQFKLLHRENMIPDTKIYDKLGEFKSALTSLTSAMVSFSLNETTRDADIEAISTMIQEGYIPRDKQPLIDLVHDSLASKAFLLFKTFSQAFTKLRN